MPALVINVEVKAPSKGGNPLRWGEKNNARFNMQSYNPTILWCTFSRLGSLSNDSANSNENVKKAIGLISKTTALHVHHPLLYINLPLSHNYGVKNLEHKMTLFFFFWTLILSFRIQLPKSSPVFVKTNEM